ncbi:MAG: hypothetical protein QOI21_3608 [Actinomycetota bacterium]|jgi:GNAT superfamily N-acetyltransferase|nr:hypothetical protein [Actinomycetota bacterium]
MGRDVVALRLELSGRGEAEELGEGWRVRGLVQADVGDVGTLAFTAYRGTVDDEGETLEEQRAEIAEAFAGKYGTMQWDAGFGAWRAGELAACTVVTVWKERPLLAFVLTAPEWQGQGLATQLVLRSAQALAAQHQTELTLAVTRANPALLWYQKLGFTEFTP